jgi:hypothetical protein
MRDLLRNFPKKKVRRSSSAVTVKISRHRTFVRAWQGAPDHRLINEVSYNGDNWTANQWNYDGAC